jgi:hypothetical protein
MDEAIFFEIETLRAERDKLLAFKAYVHSRLDAAGVPVDPDSPHKADGCRIGGRLDIVLRAYRDVMDAKAEEEDWPNRRVEPCPSPG